MLTNTDYLFALLLSFLASAIFVPVVIWLAKKLNILDKPDSARKIHKKPTPLLGGLAIFIAFHLIILIYYRFSSALDFNLLPKYLFGIFLGSLIILIGGILDDKYNLAPKIQIVFPVLAIAIVIVSGIGIDWLKNPFGQGIISLDKYEMILFWFHGLPYKLTLVADLFTLFWLLGMTYTTKIMDGIDGLVAGISIIGGLYIFLFSLNKEIAQPDVALLAIIFVGCYLGFLLFNFNPAKIFLGESGSIFSGFILGVLSIISGSKVAITLILMGIPILDVLWTIIRRLMEKKHPFKTADRKHLHHRLLDAGFSVRKACLFLWSLAVIFGLAALILQNLNYGLLILGVLVLLVFFLLTAYLYKKIREKQKSAID